MDYKEFIDQIELHLKHMTAADLKHVIRAMAEDVKGVQRHTFLSQLESIYSEKEKKAVRLRKQQLTNCANK
ncbi:MAG: hypothetical protein LRY35_00360 [Clostridiales bacterium]|nr:hypothetical protein [Clostridiales bacterium]